MIKNRRQFLKALALSPLVLAHPVASAARLFGSTAGRCDCVNILLHGFFFLEFQKDEFGKDMLVVASPNVNGHMPLFRDHGSWQLQQLPPMLDLRNQMTPGSRLDFPDRMLYFSKSDINIQRPNFIDLGKTYSFVMKLPPPRDIVPLRNGLRSDLLLTDGSVTRSIKRLSNSQHVALVVRLKYDVTFITDPFFPSARNYYEEHCHIPTLDEMKKTLDAARAVFGKEFDLDIPSLKDATVNEDDQGHLPDEISPDDEKALLEGAPCFDLHFKQSKRGDSRTVEPSTCPLFGVGP